METGVVHFMNSGDRGPPGEILLRGSALKPPTQKSGRKIFPGFVLGCELSPHPNFQFDNFIASLRKAPLEKIQQIFPMLSGKTNISRTMEDRNFVRVQDVARERCNRKQAKLFTLRPSVALLARRKKSPDFEVSPCSVRSFFGSPYSALIERSL